MQGSSAPRNGVIVDKGGEGVILRDPNSPFEQGRLRGYLKHKVIISLLIFPLAYSWADVFCTRNSETLKPGLYKGSAPINGIVSCASLPFYFAFSSCNLLCLLPQADVIHHFCLQSQRSNIYCGSGDSRICNAMESQTVRHRYIQTSGKARNQNCQPCIGSAPTSHVMADAIADRKEKNLSYQVPLKFPCFGIHFLFS